MDLEPVRNVLYRLVYTTCTEIAREIVP